MASEHEGVRSVSDGTTFASRSMVSAVRIANLASIYEYAGIQTIFVIESSEEYTTMSRYDHQVEESNAPRVSLAGCVIVASPSLTDGIFGRSVCILVEHTPDRVVGIVLNRRIEADVRPIWNHILEGCTAAEQSAHVNFGGPLSGPIIAIHQDKELAEGGNELGIYLAAEAEHLRKLVRTEQSNYRLFIGHALWAPSELEKQVVEGHWHVLPAVPELVFDDEAGMWTRAIRTIGNGVLESATGLPVSSILGSLN